MTQNQLLARKIGLFQFYKYRILFCLKNQHLESWFLPVLNSLPIQEYRQTYTKTWKTFLERSHGENDKCSFNFDLYNF